MAQQRSTFSKLQRDRDKKDKAAAKAERRGQKATPVDAPPAEVSSQASQVDEAEVLASLAELHEALDAGSVSTDDFETRRALLLSQLQVG